ncbi:RadA [Streptococcus thermophilus CNCM I-1630]|nr:RadA [Streptococcus thermophilus CNCM I-1630]
MFNCVCLSPNNPTKSLNQIGRVFKTRCSSIMIFIQTIMTPEIFCVQVFVSQVREVTAELIQIAKTNNIATFIVGHVTKEGQLAGPRMLEHSGGYMCIYC